MRCRVAALALTLVVMAASILALPTHAAAATTVATTPAAAQSAQTPPPQAVQELARLLADPQVRAWLAVALPGGDAAAAASQPAGQPAAQPEGQSPQPRMIVNRMEKLKERIATLAMALDRFPAELDEAITIMSFELDAGTTSRALGATLAFLALGMVTEALFRRATRRVRADLREVAGTGLPARLGRTGLRLLLAVLDVGAFGLGSAGAQLSLTWPPIVGLLTFVALLAVIGVRLALAVASRVLAPGEPALRLVPVGDAAARALTRWIGLLAAVVVCGTLLNETVHELGLMRQSWLVIPAGFGLLAAVLLIAFIWRVQGVIRSRGGADDRPAPAVVRAARDLWPVLATLAVLLTWLAFVLAAERMGWTLLALCATGALVAIVRSAIDAAGGAGTADASPLLPAVRRSAAVAVLLGGIAFLAQVWGVDLLDDGRGGRIGHAVLDIGVALLVADLIWSIARTLIDRRLGPPPAVPGLHEDAEGGESAGPEARLRTLLPLVRTTLLVVLVVLFGLILLSALGIDIAPFLAGAGILGLAIGFGAQALVRDIVSGFFFLVEDAFRIGEYVEFGNLRGTVEGISIRSMRLRHHLGAIHTVPYGEIKSLTNHSRDWTMVRLEFRLPFETDLTQVRKIVKRIGLEMSTDPEYAQDFLMPLKSQGVRRWEEFNMVVGVKFCTRPGKQWVIRRDAYQRIRDAFTAAGIQFASRDVTVKVSSGASPAEVEAAAAQAAVDASQPRVPATAASR